MRVDLPELVQGVGTFRRSAYVAPEIKPTAAQRTDLLRIYMRLVRGWQERFRDNILPTYERTLSELVTDDAGDLQTQIGLSDRQMAQLAAAAGFSVDEWIKRVERWHRGRFAQSFRPTGVKLDTLLSVGDVTKTLGATLGENVALIRSLNDQMRNDISGEVFRALQNRTTARDLARAVRKRAAVGQSRAELIAADQLQKLTGALDAQRQGQVGIKKFQWAHSGKANPRPEHVARDGKIYAWTDPVAVSDPPGRAIRCGCRARAVLEMDDDEAVPVEQAPEPPPPPPPPPSPPARGRFVTPRVESLSVESLPKTTKAKVQAELNAQTAEAANDPRYDRYVRFKPRKGVVMGQTKLPSSFTPEAAALVRALKPEIDNIADQFDVPRLRQIAGVQSSRAGGDMGDGGLGLNGSYFSDLAAPSSEAATAALDAQRAAIAAQIRDDLKPRFEAVEAKISALPAKTGVEYAALASERSRLLDELARLRKHDEKLWRAQQVAKQRVKTVATWTPTNTDDPPYSVHEYFTGAADEARALLYHEMGHHVHQYHKRQGPVREFGLPPVERAIDDAYREALREPAANFPSRYSKANAHEWFAENFALYTMGRPDLTGPVARKLIERILNDEI